MPLSALMPPPRPPASVSLSAKKITASRKIVCMRHASTRSLGKEYEGGSKIREFWMALCEYGCGRLNPSSIFPPISFYILSIAAVRRRRGAFCRMESISPLTSERASVLPPSLFRPCVPTGAANANSNVVARRHVRARKAIAKPKDGRTDKRQRG